MQNTNQIPVSRKCKPAKTYKKSSFDDIYKGFQTLLKEVIGGREFLSSSFVQVIHLISSDKLIVPSEEKVFESVTTWVRHNLESRQCFLPLLMEHVRLALTSNDYIKKKVAKDPLIKMCLKCKRYVFEALKTLNGEELIPPSIRNRPRHGDKV
eukprot:XP_016660752.1 PREDICTED: kelch-like protein 3 [Acyrthosiphon pisum]